MHQFLLGVCPGDVKHVMGHRVHRRVRLVHGMQNLITQKPVDEFVDAIVQRRGEQQPLPPAGVAARIRVTPGRKPRSAM